MRFIHTSDWHLGAVDGERSLIEDQRFFIDQLCDMIQEKKVKAIVIAGDVFDRSLSSAEAIALYDYAMTRFICELKIQVLTIAGNHDSAERLASCNEILSAAGLHIAGALSEKVHCVEVEDTEFFLLPWITEEKVKSVYPEKKGEIDSLEDAYRVVVDEIKKCFTDGKKHVLVAHAYVTGSETSTSDRAAEIGFAPRVTTDVLEGFDYVALGHIHGPQKLNKNERIRYSGTPMPYSFGKEENQVKSVVLVDTESDSIELLPLDLLHSRITLNGTKDEILNPQGMGLTPKQMEGYIRIHITDEYVGLALLSQLREIYPNLFAASGISFEGENSRITLTIEELEKMETDPIEVFKHFCKEQLTAEATDHQLDLFMNAVKEVEG